MVANLVITDPDHTNQDVSLAVIGNDNPQMQAKFLKLMDDMKHMDNDFQHLTKISALVSSLHKEYEVCVIRVSYVRVYFTCNDYLVVLIILL